MEKDILEIIKYIGFWGSALIITLLIFYKYGDKIMETFKIKKKNSVEDLFIAFREECKEDKDRLYAVIEDGKRREDTLNKKIDETNKTNNELSTTNRGLVEVSQQLVATNKELCDKVNFDITNIKDDMGDLKESISKINDHVIELKCKK